MIRITPVCIEPSSFDAESIRAFAEKISELEPLGVVMALEDDARKVILADVLHNGAPLDLVKALFAPNASSWRLFYGGRKILHYLRANGRWLIADIDRGPAGPIWITEAQTILDEIVRLLDMFLPGAPGDPVEYLCTEDSDRRPVPGYPEPRPFLKRRYFQGYGGYMILHHRLQDQSLDGRSLRTFDYVLEAPHLFGFGRFSQTFDTLTLELIDSKGPEEVESVGF